MQRFKSPEQAQDFPFAHAFHADISCQPPLIAQSGPRRSMSGSRRRALGIRRDQQRKPPSGPHVTTFEVNVTMPS